MNWNLADPMSLSNRVSCWVVFFVSLMLIGDLIWNLATGGHYQAMRHTVGLLGLAWVVLFWAKAIRAARDRLSDELAVAAASDPAMEQAMPRVNLVKLARAEVLLGPRRRNSLLRKQLAGTGSRP